MTRTLVAALLSILAFAACDSRRPSTEFPVNGVPSNLVLRTYDVPNNGAQRLRSVLKDLLWFGSEEKGANKYVGRADVTPDGRLIVLAPEAVHEGVKMLVSSITAKPVAEPGTLTLNYWVVIGAPGKSETPPTLAEIAPALAELEKNDGPMSFTLVEKLQVSSMANDRGKINGRDTSVRQFTSVNDGQLVAEIELERQMQKVETRVRLKSGQMVVLASSGVPTRDQSDSGHSMYFLVRAAPYDGEGR